MGFTILGQSALKSLICDAESNTNAEENASAAFININALNPLFIQ